MAHNKTILFLSSNPAETAPLKIKEEYEKISAAITKSQSKVFNSIKKDESSVSTNNLVHQILASKPCIIHFSGHGSEKGQLIFTGEGEKKVPINNEGLAELFGQFKDSLKLVVLNACYSKTQAEAIVKYIPLVIGVPDAINDGKGLEFVEAFYLCLGYGKKVEEAFNIAMAQTKLVGIIQDKVNLPHLLPQKEGDTAITFAKPKTLNNVTAAKRAQIASKIAAKSNWDELGLQFELELNGKTISRAELVADKGEHANPTTLAKHLIELLAGRLLPVSSFKRALIELGMDDTFDQFSEELNE